MAKLKWTDSEEIAIRLLEKMPDQDPLAVRFTELRDWVCRLEEFADDPKSCNEAKLEAIQMAWVQERNES